LRETAPLNIAMKAILCTTLCLFMASVMVPIQTLAAVAEKGLVCASQGALLSS